MHPLNEPPGSEVTPRSLISRAVGLWFKTQEERGRYVFLLVTPSQTGRAKEAGREGGRDGTGRQTCFHGSQGHCVPGRGWPSRVGSNKTTAGNGDSGFSCDRMWLLWAHLEIPPGRWEADEAAAQQPPSVLISPLQRFSPLQLLPVTFLLKS